MQVAGFLLRSSLSANTRKAYRTSLLHFEQFHVAHYGHRPSKSISIKKLAQFIAFCHSAGLKYSTIASRVSAISYFCKLRGEANPADGFLVKKLLMGCKHLTSVQDRRKPITISLLKRLLSSISRVFSHQYNIVLFQAMLTLAFFALLRVSEYTVTTANHTLRKGDLQILFEQGQPVGLTLKLQHYKHSHSPATIQVKHQADPSLCPVAHVARYMQLRSHGDGPFFLSSKGIGITDKLFRVVFRRILTHAGLNTTLFTPHSLRIGGATLAHDRHFSDAQIRSLGRWSSTAFSKYIRPQACPL